MTDEIVYNTTVDPHAIQQLRKFKADNSYGIYKMPEDPDAPATDDEIRKLLIHAAQWAPRHVDQVILPRNLEALRVIKLVPEDVGAALFEEQIMEKLRG